MALHARPERKTDVVIVGAGQCGLAMSRALSRRAIDHIRLYRGRDVQWWLQASRVLDQRIEDMDDAQRARQLPSPQLIGSDERATLDLNTLQRQGVELRGRLVGLRGDRALFSGSLRNVCALADQKMNRMLDGFDAWATARGLDGAVGAAQRFDPTEIGAAPRLDVTLGRDVRTIVWATGYLPDHHWLAMPVFDRRGALRHDRGVVEAPGLYVLGLPFLRRRKSSFIHGAGDDVREIAAHLAVHLDRTARAKMQNVAVRAALG